MKAKELRNQIVNKLWSYGKLPKNIQTLMTDNEVDFMLEIINTYVAEQLLIHSVGNHVFCPHCGDKRQLKVETDLNSIRVCKSALCKGK